MIAQSEVRSQLNAQLISETKQKNDFTFWLIFGLSSNLGLSETLSERLIQNVKWPVIATKSERHRDSLSISGSQTHRHYFRPKVHKYAYVTFCRQNKISQQRNFTMAFGIPNEQHRPSKYLNFHRARIYMALRLQWWWWWQRRVVNERDCIGQFNCCGNRIGPIQKLA